MVEYDNVATATSLDTVAWFTRGSPATNEALAYWEKRDGGTETEIPIATPPTPYLLPVAVGTDDAGWVAVAVSREVPRGGNTGVRAWTGTARAGGQVLSDGELPLSSGPPESVSAARTAGTSVVAWIEQGTARLYRQEDSAAGTWAPVGLDDGRQLLNLRITSDGERFVLAGVDQRNQARLWVSDDGTSWKAVDGDGMPDEMGSVALLTPVERGRVVVGWYSVEDSAPFNATTATVQSFSGAELVDEGQVTADGDRIHRVDLAGAGRGGDDGRLAVVGAAVRANGTITPMIWVRHGDGWRPSAQPELIGRLDYQFRAIAPTHDGTLVGLITGVLHVDVEAWSWKSPD